MEMIVLYQKLICMVSSVCVPSFILISVLAFCRRYGAQSVVNSVNLHFRGHCACAEVISGDGSISDIDQYGIKSLCTKCHACFYKITTRSSFGAMAFSRK